MTVPRRPTDRRVTTTHPIHTYTPKLTVYVCDNCPFLSSPVGPRSTDATDRSIDRSNPSRARDRSWPIVTRRQSLPSIPTPRLGHSSAERATGEPSGRARGASLARAASWVRLVRFDAMRAREGRGTGRGRVCSRVASRRVAFVVVARGRWMITRAREGG